MWPSKYSRANKELIIDRIGKNPYSKELVNLILTRIDIETTFMHHALPGAIDFLRNLFGDIDLGTSYTSALEVLKRYCKEGEQLHGEYLNYLDDLGALNISDEGKREFLKEKEQNEDGFDAEYGWKLMIVYSTYQYRLLNILKLDEKISSMQALEDEEKKEMLENKVSKKKTMITKALDYFKENKRRYK